MASELDFVRDDDEADLRARRFRATDPFPSIPKALLSSAEIHDYVRVTAMLHPFDKYNERSSLKPASYEVRAGGKHIIWDKDGQRITDQIRNTGRILLPKNSISFVQTEAIFRLPFYIAIRFNLRITHVHRGLLLGTGPLVDPGFQGRIFIPLHNLTDSDYDLDTSKGLIWIEFTKTTYKNLYPIMPPNEREQRYSEFPLDKCYKEPDYYIGKANSGNPIRSSLPKIIEDVRERSESAVDSAKAAEQHLKTLKRYGLIGLVGTLAGVIVTAVTIIFNSFALLESTKSLVVDALSLSDSLSREVNDLKRDNERLNLELTNLREKIDETNSEAQSQKEGLNKPQGKESRIGKE